MNLFHRPDVGVVGDCIPYHHDGRYHLFYLRDYRDLDGRGWGSPWHHVSTTDGVTFVDHGEAIAKGTAAEQDAGPGTGSVVTDDAGLHHIFYTGINPAFRTETRREQVVLHATSPDLDRWTKDPTFVLEAGEGYERHDWRDPYVFRHPVTGRFTMLLAARTLTGESSGRGCTAVLTSEDLRDWEVVDRYAPGRYHGHECPDLFRIDDWYYLVFSEYTVATVTRYAMSRSPDGPWLAPRDDQLDTRACYAAKSAAPTDGGARLLFGWNPTKAGERDDGEWQWGGGLTVHEMHRRPDGTLGLAPPPALLASFGAAGDEARRVGAGAFALDGVSARSSRVVGELAEVALVEGEIELTSAEGTAGLLLGVDENGEGGYFVRLDAGLGVAQFGKVGGHRPWYVDRFPELDRRVPLAPGEPVRVRVVLDGSAVVVYLADVALSARAYDRSGWFGAFADGARARFHGLVAREQLPAPPHPGVRRPASGRR